MENLVDSAATKPLQQRRFIPVNAIPGLRASDETSTKFPAVKLDIPNNLEKRGRLLSVASEDSMMTGTTLKYG